MKRVIATTPTFVYGADEEHVVDLKTLLEEVLTCYQKCVLWVCGRALRRSGDVAVQVNACSELYIDIITKRIACLQKDDVCGAWTLIRDISRVVMGDAPLLDIFSESWSAQQQEVEKEEPKKEEESVSRWDA